ncbi:MAG TPA: hypothetical protein PKC19_21515 [Roseiflexaceae bacterium]|nr:hypothetical protein [Roseiflexaceae bacterium]
MNNDASSRVALSILLICTLALIACSDTPAALPPVSMPPVSPTPVATPAPPRPEVRAPQTAAPLTPLGVVVHVPGYAGSAELALFDAADQPAGLYPLLLENGTATLQVLPRGGLGLQRAEVRTTTGNLLHATPLFTLDAHTTIITGQPRIDEIYPRVRRFMQQCVLDYTLDGSSVRGYRSPDNPLLWLRDHTYQGRGFRYFETDVVSLVEAFRRAQRPDGSLPDFLARPGVADTAGRKQVEADVEYLFVMAVYDAWQITGDDTLLQRNLEPLRRALRYSMSDPLRWDAERGLVKRPFTIDTWDFEYGPTTRDPTTGRPAPRHWIDDQTIWGIFHGDNTGLAAALRLMAQIERRVGDAALAEAWHTAAAEIMQRLNDLSWNGSFYYHHVPLEPFVVPGVDTTRQLSLSNALALNRDVLRRQQGRAIVEEYFRRSEQRGTAFAAWYSIDPPFPPGSYGLAGRPGENPGEYVNGGIMPLVGGELARGAFRYGAERFGFDILHRYHFLISSTNATYLWYYPAGNPGISGVDTLPTDGWGASAMLAALIEGAAGIEDRGALLRDVRISPRWAATDDIRQAYVVARYAASNAYLAYRWELGNNTLRFNYTGTLEQSTLRLLLPNGIRDVATVTLNGMAQPYTVEERYGSFYLTLETNEQGELRLTW